MSTIAIITAVMMSAFAQDKPQNEVALDQAQLQCLIQEKMETEGVLGVDRGHLTSETQEAEVDFTRFLSDPMMNHSPMRDA